MTTATAVPTTRAGRTTCAHRAVNVGGVERVISMLAGGGLVAAALSRRSTYSLPLALVGAALVYRGASGHCTTYRLLGIDRSGDS